MKVEHIYNMIQKQALILSALERTRRVINATFDCDVPQTSILIKFKCVFDGDILKTYIVYQQFEKNYINRFGAITNYRIDKNLKLWYIDNQKFKVFYRRGVE